MSLSLGWVCRRASGMVIAIAPMTLKSLIVQHDRRIVGEALLTLGVGIVSCIVTFGVLFWVAWLAFWFMPRWHGMRPWEMAACVTGLFAIGSIWGAWRRLDPISDVQIDPGSKAGTGQDLALGLMIGIPIFRKVSIAGTASLFIGGPANIIDSVQLWKSRIGSDEQGMAAAAALLHASHTGVPVESVNDPHSIAMLARLGLIKANEVAGVITIQATAKGREVFAGA